MKTLKKLNNPYLPAIIGTVALFNSWTVSEQRFSVYE